MKFPILLALIVALAGCDAQPPQATRAATPGITVPQVGVTQVSVGQVLNAMRARNGLAAMRQNPTLDRIAQAHAADMAATHNFSHIGRDGRGSWQRAQAAGYNPRLMAENIAWGPYETGEVLRLWQARADHRSNQMHPRAQEFGIGIAGSGARTYWVLVMGSAF